MALTAIRVVVDAPQYSGVGVALDYLSEQPLAPGTFVRVPLGRREVAGIVWSDAPGAPGAPPAGVELRPVMAALRAFPRLDGAVQLRLAASAGALQLPFRRLDLRTPALGEQEAARLDPL